MTTQLTMPKLGQAIDLGDGLRLIHRGGSGDRKYIVRRGDREIAGAADRAGVLATIEAIRFCGVNG